MDPERMLGALVKSALFGRRLPASSKVALGMGALGIAIAAVEHLAEKRGTQARPGAGGTPPPPPPVAPPPPVPTAAPNEALLVARAMIAAAHADGVLDEAERQVIASRWADEGMSAEERAALQAELATPCAPEQLAAQVTSPRLAEEVYAASLLAIRLDTPAEHRYLAQLAQLLALDRDTVARWHRLLGAPLPS